MKYDLLIKNGLVVSGEKECCCRRADVAILGGRIAAVGKLAEDWAGEVIDADGLAVCPGFIDGHAHSEISVWQSPDCLAKASQGITTELAGQCGISAYPVLPGREELIEDYTGTVLGKSAKRWPWGSLAEYREELRREGTAINQGAFIGHGNLRINAMGFADREPSGEELRRMREQLSAELSDGAFGMSSGLVYPPGLFSRPQELTELARVCAAAGGIYTTHMRNEGNRLLEAVEEAIGVAEASGVQLVISHLKASGKPNHGKVKKALEMIEAAAGRGVRVNADCYPYDAASTTMTIILPPWIMTGGIEGLVESLKDREKRRRVARDLREGLPDWDNRVTNLGYDRISIASVASEKNKGLEGLSLLDAARRKEKEPGEFILDLLLEERGQVSAVLRGMSEEDVKTALASPRIMVCTDGVPVGGKPHPRLYGAFTRYLSRYADLSSAEGLASAIYKLTAFPAEVYGLRDLGRLLPGYWADITIFDPARVRDQATFMEPERLSEGIEWVIVGGQTVIRQKRPTGRRPGRFLRRG